MLIGSIAASSSGSFQVNYLPQFFMMTASTVPTAFRIEMQEDGVIFNLDGTGLDNLNGLRCVGALAANTYIFQLADGRINETATFTITNAIAAQLDIYGFSEEEPGEFYIKYLTVQALANTDLQLTKFAYAAFPSMGANDQLNVVYADEAQTVFTRLELAANLGYKQDVTATRYNIDNFDPARIKQASFLGAAAQAVYVVRYQSIGQS